MREKKNASATPGILSPEYITGNKRGDGN